MKKNTPIFLIVVTVIYTLFTSSVNYVLAEESNTDSLPESSINNDQEQIIESQISTDAPLIQETTNTQEASGTEILLVDQNIEIIPPLDVVENSESNATTISENTETSTSSGTIDSNVVPVEDVESISSDQLIVDEPEHDISESQVIRRVELKPKSIYSFAVSNKKINSKKEFKNTTLDNFNKSKLVDNNLTPRLKSDGAVSVAGQCNSKYFVILVYKNENDYINNPGDTVYNKAFDCTNNSFSYSISDLPETLKDAKYYLLVGQQGETGTWVPISNITEISVNKNLSVFKDIVENQEIKTLRQKPTPVETIPQQDPQPEESSSNATTSPDVLQDSNLESIPEPIIEDIPTNLTQ